MRKDIVILGTHGIPAKHGGFETCAEKLALYLTAQGWHVTVFGHGKTNEKKVWQNITCHTIKNIRLPVLRYLNPLLYDLRAIWATRKIPGVVLTLGYNTALFNLLLIGRPQIINMDGMEWRRPKYKRWHEKAWLKLNEYCALKIADICTADHPAIATYLQTCNAKSRIETIAYGADTIDPVAYPADRLKSFSLLPDTYGLVIARPEPENQILEIVQAWIKSGTSQKLVILGHYKNDNDYHRAVKQAANNHVIFLGAVFDLAIVNALRVHAALYFHGHTVGGTNPSLVEAMAAGCVIIAHDNIYNRGVTADGALYFSSVNHLVRQIEILQNSSRRNALKDAALKRHADHYQWQPLLQHYARLLENVQQTPC